MVVLSVMYSTIELFTEPSGGFSQVLLISCDRIMVVSPFESDVRVFTFNSVFTVI